MHGANAQAMWIPQALSLLQSGVASNWWGVGCPSYCGGSVLLLGLVFLVGFASGAAGILYLFRSSFFSAGPLQDLSPCASGTDLPEGRRPSSLRLRKYLYAYRVVSDLARAVDQLALAVRSLSVRDPAAPTVPASDSSPHGSSISWDIGGPSSPVEHGSRVAPGPSAMRHHSELSSSELTDSCPCSLRCSVPALVLL